jgi:hypothetical protein
LPNSLVMLFVRSDLCGKTLVLHQSFSDFLRTVNNGILLLLYSSRLFSILSNPSLSDCSSKVARISFYLSKMRIQFLQQRTRNGDNFGQSTHQSKQCFTRLLIYSKK